MMDFSEFRGKWIGQADETVLVVGDSPDEVIDQLRAMGKVATVWQVPATLEKAEQIWLET